MEINIFYWEYLLRHYIYILLGKLTLALLKNAKYNRRVYRSICRCEKKSIVNEL